jgi:cyclopropane fatty-acyl-phospholipid synthase-like methyltransferase
MRIRSVTLALLAALAIAAPAAAQATAPQTETGLRKPDIFYLPTPQAAVEAMLVMAKVTAADVVYDLGSGDGRIPITAAKKYGARGVGIDIDPQRIKEATENAEKQGVSNKVRFMNADLFETDFSEATVITLYLLQTLNEKLEPTLKKLKPGTRIVSHAFQMSSAWPPDQSQQVTTEDGGTVNIYFWTVK